MKVFFKFLGRFVLVVLFAIVILLIAAPIVNNFSASEVEKELLEIPLPEKTECLESVSIAAKLVGNGNGMQFLGAMLLKSELSQEELETYFSRCQQNEYECLVEVQTGQELNIVEHKKVLFETKLLEGEQYYIVYTWGDGIEPFCDFDLRGN